MYLFLLSHNGIALQASIRLIHLLFKKFKTKWRKKKNPTEFEDTNLIKIIEDHLLKKKKRVNSNTIISKNILGKVNEEENHEKENELIKVSVGLNSIKSIIF